MFRNGLKNKSLGIEPITLDNFMANDHDILMEEMMKFANKHLGYNHTKGLDFVGHLNKRYVIGEAKFLDRSVKPTNL